MPGAGATPAAFGFVVALLARLCAPSPCGEGLGAGKVFLVVPAYGLRDYGRPHGHGLRALGLDPRRLIVIETAHRRDTLWAMEEALRSRAPAAVAGVIDKLDLKTSQRLQLAATDSGLPLFLLRPAATLESSAAATRWRIGTAPAARDRFGLIERSRWQGSGLNAAATDELANGRWSTIMSRIWRIRSGSSLRTEPHQRLQPRHLGPLDFPTPARSARWHEDDRLRKLPPSPPCRGWLPRLS